MADDRAAEGRFRCVGEFGAGGQDGAARQHRTRPGTCVLRARVKSLATRFGTADRQFSDAELDLLFDSDSRSGALVGVKLARWE